MEPCSARDPVSIYNPNSKAYRRACAELVTAMATRYANHPALAMWHVNNEYACHVSEDFGVESADAFREWLRARYKSLDALNEAWGTAFWSQHYYDWNEVLPPRTAPTFPNPGQTLDFHRFSSDALLECLDLERQILREFTPNIPITTNLMWWFKPLDYRKWAGHLDWVSVDVYPEPNGSRMPLCEAADFARSLGNGQPWLVLEQVTTHVNWRRRNSTKSPGQMRLWSYEHLARGADGICFFQWRQSHAGAEKFHGAMVGHGEPTSERCFNESKSLGLELQRLSEIAGSRFDAKVGIVFDHENWWALELPSKPNNDLRYMEATQAFYRPLLELNIGTDYVFGDSDWSRYKLLFVPTLYLIKSNIAEKLEDFVSKGGIIVVTYFSGIVDENDRILLGGYPAPLRRLLGLRVEEWSIPAENQAFTITTSESLGLADSYAAAFWAEVVRTEGANPVATFNHGYLSGLPAVTRNAFGSGEAWYIATAPEPIFFDDLAKLLTTRAGVSAPINAPKGVGVTKRINNETEYLFLLNHSGNPVQLDLGELRGQELLTNTAVSKSLDLAENGVAIVRAERPD